MNVWKTNEEILSILNKTLYFNNRKMMCNELGFEYNSNNLKISLNRLSLFCEWHKDDDNKIYIDKVFDKPKQSKYDFKYEINDIIHSKTSDFMITNRYKKYFDSYGHKSKTYYCKCLNDGYEFELKEHHLTQGIGCPECGKRKPLLGKNTIYDKRKDLLQYIVNEEDSKKYTVLSSKKILCKCPNCKQCKNVIIRNLSKFGFSCSYCSDHISYPNKFIRSFLNQAKINYIPEKRFDWSDNKIYDFFLPDYNYIIEANGLQHYKQISSNRFRSLEDEMKNDEYKREMAINNGIKKYIVLDCRNSNMEFIKNSIMSSELLELLSLNIDEISWIECERYSMNSMILDVCNAWIKNNNITELSKEFMLDPHTIIDYLQRGSLLGLCDYKKGNREHMRKISRDVKTKPILCKELNILFYGRNECEAYFKNIGYKKFNGKLLYNYINKNKKYNNYTFQYIEKSFFNSEKEKYDNNNSSYKVFGDYYLKGA